MQRLDQWLQDTSINTAKNIQSTLPMVNKSMRLDDFISGNIGKALPMATQAVKDTVTLPFQRPEQFIEQQALKITPEIRAWVKGR